LAIFIVHEDGPGGDPSKLPKIAPSFYIADSDIQFKYPLAYEVAPYAARYEEIQPSLTIHNIPGLECNEFIGAMLLVLSASTARPDSE
jgi:hypothetical protein